MDSAVLVQTKPQSASANPSEFVEQVPTTPTILVATVAPEICSELKGLLEPFSFKTIWSKGVEAAKKVLAKERVDACLCGFWLQDGTYRELVRHIRRENMDIPLILIADPSCPHEYRDYVAALNIGALDFLSHPYRKSDLEGMLRLVVGEKRPALVEQRLSVVERSTAVRPPTSLVGPDLHPRRAA